MSELRAQDAMNAGTRYAVCDNSPTTIRSRAVNIIHNNSTMNHALRFRMVQKATSLCIAIATDVEDFQASSKSLHDTTVSQLGGCAC